MTDLPTNVLRPTFRKPRLVADCQSERPKPISLTDAMREFRIRQTRSKAEIARDKFEDAYAEFKRDVGPDAAQEQLRAILLLECTP